MLSLARLKELTKEYSQEEIDKAVRLGCARYSLYGFVMYTMPEYKMGWVHEEICRELEQFYEDVVNKKSPRLMLTMPPRHGKTELASRRFPAYAFGRNPDIAIISTSYSADLATGINRDVQRIIDNSLYREVFTETELFGKNVVTVAQGSFLRNSEKFEIVNHKGIYRSAGVGGGITGMGGDILIVDDPFKDRAEADSPTIRKKVWDWYTSTLSTRLSSGGGILLIQTRWHEDDLAGRLLAKGKEDGGEKWRVVNFPAIAEVDEKHRKKGEALHPERFPLNELEAKKRAIGTRDFSALYQQRPTTDGGTIFKQEWFNYWLPKDLPKAFDKVILSWDLAFKDSDSSDFVVGQVWGKSGGNFYLLYQIRKRMDFVETLRAFIPLAEKYPDAKEKLVEEKANGAALISVLKREISGIIAVNPTESKTARAHAVTPFFEAGNVFIPHRQCFDWVDAYVTELLQFPSSPHDDQVDAMTQALHRLGNTRQIPLTIHPSNIRQQNMRQSKPFF